MNEACKGYNNHRDFEFEGNIYLFGYTFLCNVVACVSEMRSYISTFPDKAHTASMGIDMKLLLCKGRMLNCHRLLKDLEQHGEKQLDEFGFKYGGQPITTALMLSNLIRENVKLLKSLLDDVCHLLLKAGNDFFERYYLNQKKQVAVAPLEVEFHYWKLNTVDVTMDVLREKQALVTAEVLKKGVLKYDSRPTARELKMVRLDILTDLLPKGYPLPDDFDCTCAKFKRISSWDGLILNLNYSMLGKYLFMNDSHLTASDVQHLVQLDIKLQLINKEMLTLMFEKAHAPAPQLPQGADKYWQRLKEKGFVDANCQPLSGVTRKQMMYIADLFSEKLGMTKSKWKYFEELWHINNLAQEKWQCQQTGTLPERYKTIDAVFSD